MKSSLESTALRPIFGIGRMSTLSRSRSVRNSVMPSVFLLDVLELGRAREQQHLLGLERLGDPDLAAVDDVVAPSRLREGRDPGGVEAGVGLGDAEADVQVAVDDPRQGPLLELLGAVLDHRVHAEDRQVHRAGAVHARRRSAATSSSSSDASRMPSPAPPYSSGVVMPIQPASANAL